MDAVLLITARKPWLPTSAAVALTLRSLPSVTADDQEEIFPASNPSAKIRSAIAVFVGALVLIAVAVAALVAVAVCEGREVAVCVKVGNKVLVAVGVGVSVNVLVGVAV